MRLGDGGVTKGGMTNRPGSATNLKASQSTLLSCSAPDTRSGYRTKGSSGTKLREEQTPCLSLDRYRSDPSRADWRSLENSDLSPLAKKEVYASSMWRALRPWICSGGEKGHATPQNVLFASREALPFSFTLWRPGLDVILFLSVQLLDSL